MTLAIVLTVLVTVGAPMVASKTTLELKDWLGFAGNILGALVTLVAAYVAWRAVQRQVRTERNATLLDVTSREEVRLEAELHAISVFEDLYLLTISGHEPMQIPQNYIDMMKAVGFSQSVSETRAALRSRVGGAIPPIMLEGFAIKYASLTKHVERLRTTQQQVNSGNNDPHLIDILERLPIAIMQWETEIEQAMDELSRRKNLISNELLPAYRSIITSGLKVLHD